MQRYLYKLARLVILKRIDMELATTAQPTRYLGRCPICKRAVRRDVRGEIPCPSGCHTVVFYRDGNGKLTSRPGWEQIVYMYRIKGVFSDKKCDRKCTHAVGHTCDCSCGGANHGAAWA